LQNTLTGTGLTYQWQSSPNNSTWTNLSPVLISTDFSSQPANTNIYRSTPGGDATVTGGYLRLTTATNSLWGGFVIETTPGSNITPFTATFDYRIYGGSGADGMSLSFGPDIAESPGGGEAGEGSGIILMLDTYDNTGGVTTNSQIRINYAGSQIWNNTVGAFPLRNTNYQTIRLTVDNNGYLTLTIAGNIIVNSLLIPGYAVADKSNWKFKFSARTGGANDMHSIDNLTIQMGDNPTYPTLETVSTYYRCNVTCATTPSTGTSTSALATLHPNPSVALSTQSNISCFNGNTGSITLSASGGSGTGYQYSIYNGDAGTWQGTATFGSLSVGQYKIRAKDSNGCMSPAVQ
jgi:hypothetical protein